MTIMSQRVAAVARLQAERTVLEGRGDQLELMEERYEGLLQRCKEERADVHAKMQHIDALLKQIEDIAS